MNAAPEMEDPEAARPILLLDGGMGHQLRRSGVRIRGHVGSIERFLNVALANRDAPRLVVDSHLQHLHLLARWLYKQNEKGSARNCIAQTRCKHASARSVAY